VLFRGHDRWRLHRQPGEDPGAAGRVEVVVGGRVEANDIGFVRRAAVAGAGIALLPRLVGDTAVADGDLVAVLPDHRTDTAPLHLVQPARRHVPLAVRALRDHLLRHFPR
jgi:DNA-binding transcriptional LysR family regulator